MMNHCLDVICASCGYSYCALRCSEPLQDKVIDAVMKEAFEEAAKKEDVLIYPSLKCPKCGAMTIYDIPRRLNEEIKKLNTKPHQSE